MHGLKILHFYYDYIVLTGFKVSEKQFENKTLVSIYKSTVTQAESL